MYQYRRTTHTRTERCHECSSAADLDTRKCDWKHCHKLFCPSCAWLCHECGDVMCAEHSKTLGGETYCLSCHDQQYEHWQQFYELMQDAHIKQLPCPCCGSVVEDDSDPFGDPDVERTYCCVTCGSSATMKRTANEALRTAQALRYTGAASMPEPDYIVVEGTAPVKQRKPAVAATEDQRISA